MRKPSRTVRFIQKYRIAWAWITLVLYIAAIPFTIIIFPDNNMWLALIVLFTGFTASLTTLGDLLVSAEESEKSD
jgi:hypothetical protein